MRILITGGTGLLGKALIETSGHSDFIGSIYYGRYDMKNTTNVRYFNADICNKDSMEEIFIDVNPEVVIHTAGMANVDYCEKFYKEARQSNIVGTKVIAELCGKNDSKMIFISTNAVFDGKHAPYSEDSVPSPINSYGRMKLEAEEVVKNSGLKYLIVRPILMYGWNNEHERLNTVTWLINKLKKGEEVNMVNDLYENPLFNCQCAEIIWSLVDLNKIGLYHIAGKDVVNRYEFADLIAEVFCLDKKLIKAVSSGFFRGLAPRPPNTSYNTKKIEKELGIKPLSIKEGLTLMKSTGEVRVE